MSACCKFLLLPLFSHKHVSSIFKSLLMLYFSVLKFDSDSYIFINNSRKKGQKRRKPKRKLELKSTPVSILFGAHSQSESRWHFLCRWQHGTTVQVTLTITDLCVYGFLHTVAVFLTVIFNYFKCLSFLRFNQFLINL